MAPLTIGVTIGTMTGSPYGVAQGGAWPPPPGPPPSKRPQGSKLPLALILVGVLVGVIGIATAAIALTRPTESPAQPRLESSKPTFSDQEVASSVQAVCEAHSLIDRATAKAANQTSEDPAIRGLLSLNVRIGAMISSNYIVETAAKYPALPQDLADATRDLALAYNRTTLLQISEAPEAELGGAYDALDVADARVAEACT